jgi:ATP:ADP antiporter, AAA family
LHSVVRFAMLVSTIMLAHQVAGKAARDAFFLSQFSPSYFPLMVIAGSAVSIVGGLVNSRILQVVTPARMVPWAFLVSGGLHFGEWSLRHSAYWPAMVVLVYVHVVGLGAIVLSSFWSLLNERFDPRTGKKYFGRIAGVGTFGGILGGLAAERFAAWLPSTAILLFLGFAHLWCGCISFMVVRSSKGIGPAEQHHHHIEGEPVTFAAWTIFRRSKYVQKLAALVVLGTTAAALLDIIFKTQAATVIGRGDALLRFFAIFYTVAQILSFGVQLLITRKWLEKLGLARGVGSLPAAVAAGGIGALMFPLFFVFVGVRALEVILRGSIYRAGYELLYTPLPVQEKRAAKPVIDIVFDRLGDVLGGAVSEIFLALGGMFAIKSVLLVTVGIASAGIYITRRLQRLYVRVLEQGLVDRAVELEVDTESELLTRSVLLTLSLKRDSTAALPAPAHPESRLQEVRPLITDPVLQALLDLRSGNAGLVQQILSTMQQADPLLVPQVIILVAWDDLAPEALRVLRGSVDHVAGQMLDALLAEKTDFAIKRRLPRVLAYSEDQRTVQGLMHALEDSRFEVRFQCARALDVILQRHPEYRPAKEAVFAIVEREMSVSRGVWDSRRLLDRRQSTDQFLFLDEVLRERAQLSWEHLFSLLALILPRGPLKVAFQAMHTDDRFLRGLALEYLDSVLPPSLRNVQTFFEEVPPLASTGKVAKDLTTRLMDARQSVSLKLAHLPSPAQEKANQPEKK